jgi:putative transposase
VLDKLEGRLYTRGMRALPNLENGHYHVYNRGVNKQTLCYDNADYVRFLFLVLHLQAPASIPQVNRYVKNYLTTADFKVNEKLLKQIYEKRIVEVLNFCIMPNHFHLTLRALSDGAISIYMQKLGNAYSKYFNKRYNKSGHVFQGAYKMREIFDDNDLVHLSAYIHRNPHEITKWKDKADVYPWSSYQDMQKSRWGSLLCTESILTGFTTNEDYKEYVESSGAKEDFEDVDFELIQS